jgi:hypothetical protein
MGVRDPSSPRLRLGVLSVLLAGASFTVSAAGLSAAGASSSALSGAQLHALVVAPPPPFQHLPDSALKTGLMEFGNPKSGKIGTVVSTAQLKKARFQRGWESAFRADDGAVVVVDVFECATAEGAAQLTRAAQARIPSTYTPIPIDGLAGISAFAGISPDGHTVNAAVYSKGRFFVFQDVGGAPGAHDYTGLLTGLAQNQTAAIPTT